MSFNKVKYSIPNLRFRNFVLSKNQYVFTGLEDIKKHLDFYGAAKEILIFAGELCPDFYEDEIFLNNIRKSLDGKCIIKVIFGPAFHVETKKFLKIACSYSNIHLYRRRERDSAHFRIVRDKTGYEFAFIDERHPIGVDKENRKTYMLAKGYDLEIKKLKKKFRTLESPETQLDKKKFIKEFTRRGQDKETKEFFGFITEKGEGGPRLADITQIKQLAEDVETLRLAKKTNYE